MTQIIQAKVLEILQLKKKKNALKKVTVVQVLHHQLEMKKKAVTVNYSVDN
jgi:hypothetical protein